MVLEASNRSRSDYPEPYLRPPRQKPGHWPAVWLRDHPLDGWLEMARRVYGWGKVQIIEWVAPADRVSPRPGGLAAAQHGNNTPNVGSRKKLLGQDTIIGSRKKLLGQDTNCGTKIQFVGPRYNLWDQDTICGTKIQFVGPRYNLWDQDTICWLIKTKYKL